MAGKRDILGLWAGTGGARGGQQCLAADRRANLQYPFDPQHFRLTSRKHWDEIKRDVKPIYTAVNATAARSAFDELADKWGSAARR